MIYEKKKMKDASSKKGDMKKGRSYSLQEKTKMEGEYFASMHEYDARMNNTGSHAISVGEKLAGEFFPK